VGDIVATGAPLIDFDSGTVVGSMPLTRESDLLESAAPAARRLNGRAGPRALPAARAVAGRLGLALDALSGSGPDGAVTLDDVLAHAKLAGPAGARAPADGAVRPSLQLPADASWEPLRGPRRAMARSMSASQAEVPLSTVVDDADLNAWAKPGDYTLRLMRAMVSAWRVEPSLNAWYDPEAGSRALLKQIHLAIAVDTPHGLIVPVVRDIQDKSPEQLRAAVAAQKQAAHLRSIPPEDLRNFTLMLSNFGTLAGRYGVPIVVPPAVAILGAGKVRLDAVAIDGTVAAHPRMPLSLSFDHRCITGGEACRFLAAVIADLEHPD